MSTLTDRISKFNIPPAPYLPQGKNVLVFRLPSETRTAGGLYVPEEHAEAKSNGILVGAGLEAMDVMLDALIELGDEVFFGRFAGWEKEFARDPEGKGRAILQMKIEDILGSRDALERVKDYELKFDKSNGEEWGHFYDKATAKAAKGARS